MASAVTHGVIGFALSNPLGPKRQLSFALLSVFCSVVPDIDVIGFIFGLRPPSIWAHRGITHSLLFAFFLSLTVVSLAFTDIDRFSAKWWSLVRNFFLATMSHGLLDALTNGGGVAFLAPFTSERYLCPFHPLPAIGLSRFFSADGESILLVEILWLWLPAAAALLAIAWRSRGRLSPSG